MHGNAPAFPRQDFHLSQNENRHFTLCLQGCARFHARKIGEPPRDTVDEITVRDTIFAPHEDRFQPTPTESAGNEQSRCPSLKNNRTIAPHRRKLAIDSPAGRIFTRICRKHIRGHAVNTLHGFARHLRSISEKPHFFNTAHGEYPFTKHSDARRHRHALKGITMFKCAVSNIGNTFGYCYGRHIGRNKEQHLARNIV